MPAMAARMAPMMKVAEITMSGLTPMSEATRGFPPWHGAAQVGVVHQMTRGSQCDGRHAQNQDLRGVMKAPPTWKGVLGNIVG